LDGVVGGAAVEAAEGVVAFGEGLVGALFFDGGGDLGNGVRDDV
jgi:hypothetical protein